MANESLGFIAIHRQIADHWIFENAVYFKAFVTILMEVNFKERKRIIDGELIICGRGESLYSVETWAQKFGKGWTRQKVRTFFKHLENDGIIKTEGLRKTTRLSVCKYDLYNGAQPTANQQPTNSQPTANHTLTKEQRKQTPPNPQTAEADSGAGGSAGAVDSAIVELVLSYLPMCPQKRIANAVFGKTYEQVKSICVATSNEDVPIEYLIGRLEKGWNPPPKRQSEFIRKHGIIKPPEIPKSGTNVPIWEQSHEEQEQIKSHVKSDEWQRIANNRG